MKNIFSYEVKFVNYIILSQALTFSFSNYPS
jgi:hypothetical protein